MAGGESALSYARGIRADSQHPRAGSSRAKSAGESLLATTGRAMTRALELVSRAASARVLGVRTGRLARTLASREGTAYSEQGPARVFEAERHWRDLFKGVRLAVVGLDNEGRIAFANPFFLSLTGYERHELLGADWFSTFISSDSVPEVHDVFQHVLRASGAHHVNPILTKPGDQRLIAWFNTLRHGPDGSVMGTLSVGEDITDRVRAEARLRAISEVTEGVLSDKPLDALLHLWAGQARELVGADTGTIFLAQDEGVLVVAATDGIRAEGLDGASFLHDTSISSAATDRRTGELVDDASKDPRLCQLMPEPGEIGPALFVPLWEGERTLGMLVVANRRGGRLFSPDDLAILESVASHTSIALAFRRTQDKLQQLIVVEDRERIARDLHDSVIQRLFATGLNLAAIRNDAGDRSTSERLAGAIDQLDQTISDLRASIFGLRCSETTNSLRVQILDVVDAATGLLGFRPQLRLLGIDTSIDDDFSRRVAGVIREALSNIVRHARARHVFVLVDARTDLVVRVTDDGIGTPVELPWRSGLESLQAQAAELGGMLSVGAGEDGGTVLEWRAPIVR